MKRPFEDVRPLGPFADLEPADEELNPDEIRVTLTELKMSVEDTVEPLRNIEEGSFGDMGEDVSDEMESDIGYYTNQLVRMTRSNKSSLDGAASKLASKHKKIRGTTPRVWDDYKDVAEERDMLLDQIDI